MVSIISIRGHCQRSSPSRISDTPQAGFYPVQNLISGFAAWSCAVVITPTPRRHELQLTISFTKACRRTAQSSKNRNLSNALIREALFLTSNYIQKTLWVLMKKLGKTVDNKSCTMCICSFKKGLTLRRLIKSKGK